MEEKKLNAHYFDDILNNRIKLGSFQYINFFFLGMMNFGDGAEFILVSLLTPILEKEW